MRLLLILLTAGMFVFHGFSQVHSGAVPDAQAEYTSADRMLNEVYRQVLDVHKSDLRFIEKLKIAQRIWIKFRDAEVELRYPETEPDPNRTQMPDQRAIYLKRLTGERTRDLTELLHEAPNGIVGSYPLNGDARDESVFANHGRITGAVPTVDRFGSADCALSFNGVDNYIEIPNSRSLRPTNRLALTAWILVNRPGFYPAVLNKGNVGNYQESYALYLTPDNRLGFLINQDGSLEGRKQTESTFALPFDTWTHVAAVYDGAMMCVFVNGVPVARSFCSGTIFADDAPLLIGKSDRESSESPTSFFCGSIDDVKIFNRTLTAEEVNAIAAPGKTQAK